MIDDVQINYQREFVNLINNYDNRVLMIVSRFGFERTINMINQVVVKYQSQKRSASNLGYSIIESELDNKILYWVIRTRSFNGEIQYSITSKNVNIIIPQKISISIHTKSNKCGSLKIDLSNKLISSYIEYCSDIQLIDEILHDYLAKQKNIDIFLDYNQRKNKMQVTGSYLRTDFKHSPSSLTILKVEVESITNYFNDDFLSNIKGQKSSLFGNFLINNNHLYY